MMLAPDRAGMWMPVPAAPGAITVPGLIVYRFGADLFYANANRFTDEVRALVSCAAGPVRWFIVDCSAITDVDYSAAQVLHLLLPDLARTGVTVLFARVSAYMRADMDRHCLTPMVGEAHIFPTLHQALAAAGCGPAIVQQGGYEREGDG